MEIKENELIELALKGVRFEKRKVEALLAELQKRINGFSVNSKFTMQELLDKQYKLNAEWKKLDDKYNEIAWAYEDGELEIV